MSATGAPSKALKVCPPAAKHYQLRDSCPLLPNSLSFSQVECRVLTALSSGPERQRRGDRAVLLQPPAAALAGHPGGGGPGEQAHQPRVRRQGPAHLPPDQPGLVLCSAPAVPQPVFTITEKAPTRAFSWLKAPISVFTFKTLCLTGVDPTVSRCERHYANQTACP